MPDRSGVPGPPVAEKPGMPTPSADMTWTDTRAWRPSPTVIWSGPLMTETLAARPIPARTVKPRSWLLGAGEPAMPRLAVTVRLTVR